MASPIWTPSVETINSAPITRFQQTVNEQHGLSLNSYVDLHKWSVENLALFWESVWDFADVKSQGRGDAVLENADQMPGANWFPEARLNYAQNLLRRNDDSPAIQFRCEDGSSRILSHKELKQQVASLARALKAEGVVSGDRVVGFLPNIPEAVIAMLATTSIGAVWSSCSPDFGLKGVIDRFGQVNPKVLFTADGYRYNGKVHDSLDLVSELAEQLSGLKRIVVVNYVSEGSLSVDAAELATGFQGLVEDGLGSDIDYEMLPFNHPLYIMFSSGTTGKPKCIVHSAGGTLLQHLKEQQLHVGLQADEKLFFFTTCGWMMWNWLVSGLASEATLLLFDGSPFYPDGNTLFDFAQESGMHYFGTSAKYIDACNKAGISPINTHQLPHLKSMLSTGSPLVPESFDYVYEHIAKDICLSSMSGGTDILGCFALGNPTLPVYRGELQCIGLGLDVQAYSDDGKKLETGAKGELVCVKPFPSMPIGFYNDENNARYHAAYYDRFDNVWCHGDYVAMTDAAGMIIYGRSDAVLNPGGVRIGTAEIYRIVEQFDAVEEALVIGQQWAGDVRVVLFVRLGELHELSEELVSAIKAAVKKEATPRHVPSVVVQVTDIPRTRSGKIVELAVRKVVHGESIDNIEALANPEALELFRDLPALSQ